MKLGVPLKSVLALAAIAMALTGCTSTPQTQGTPGAGATVAPGEGATLTIWSYKDTPTSKQFMSDFEASFTKNHPGVKFKYLLTDFASLRNKVLTGAVSKDGPDVLIFDPADTPVLAKAGTIKNITTQWQAFNDKSQFADALTWKSGNDIYAVQGYVNTTALYYNKDILAAAGITPPTTLDELNQALIKLKAAGSGGLTICGAPLTECETQAISWILGQGGNYDNLDAPGVKSVLNTFAKWSQDGSIPKDAVTWKQDDAWKAFSTGKYAFSQAGNWKLASAKELPFKWGVVSLPGAKVAPGGEGEAIGAFSKNADLAFQYLSETFWSKAGQLAILKAEGSIPARADAAQSPDVQNDANLVAWTKEVQSAGARPPVKGGDIQKATTVLGQVWSGVLSGQLSPDAAISQLKSATTGLF